MKYILGMGLKDSYELFGAQVHVIVMIVFSISHLLQVKRRIGNANIVGWAAVEYNFKSDIIFYDVPGNKNGKLTHQVYINSILEPVVKAWIMAGEDFVLQEDGDSGHGPGKKKPVRTWKEQNGLESYFNCAQSPDLSVVENCWAIPKMYTRKYPHWDDATLENLIREGWAQVSQEFINKRVQEMPDRLRASSLPSIPSPACQDLFCPLINKLSCDRLPRCVQVQYKYKYCTAHDGWDVTS